MIEKCSIGNMSYNIQNITLIILILILIIVIIYYLKNSSAKHDELIEKYTTPSNPSNTDANVDDSANSIYGSHNSIATSQLYNFPTSGTVVTLRPCEVQFNNKFDASGTGTHTYVYEDGWQEIATLKTSSDTSPQTIEKKIISANNETNKDDINESGGDVYTNYSEQSKCFKKILSGTNNNYRYNNNDLIKYHTDKYVNLVELKDGATGAPEQYMQMEFDLESSNSSQYYNNLKTSICSLKYANTVTGLSGKLIRLTLNANNIITDIKRVTVDATNNHIFNIDTTFDIANLITTGNSGNYRYNTGLQLYEFVTTNSQSGLQATINLYKFDRNLLCDNTSGTTTYQNIKTYTKLSDAKINISRIVNFNLPSDQRITNTNLPSVYNDYYIGRSKINITTGDFTKDTLIANINRIITQELSSINSITNSAITVNGIEKQRLVVVRDAFVNANNTKELFINNAIIKVNYDAIGSIYNSLLDATNYNLKIKEFNYINESYETTSPNIKISSTDEPVFKELLSAGESDVWETTVYKYKGVGNFTEYDITFSPNTECKILIVGGGGGGGQFGGGGGGGAILFKDSFTLDGKYIIRVGKGGIGQEWDNFGKNGEDGQHSSFQKENVASETYIAKGGGGGGTRRWHVHYCDWCGVNGNPGGSGGGGSHSNDPSNQGQGGVSNKNTYTGWLSYGEAGGKGKGGFWGGEPSHASGGGGGSGSVGGDATNSNGGGNGGTGREFISTFGSSVGDSGWFGGGGGGNTYYGAGNPGYGNGGNGLLGGGGNGGYDPGLPAKDGIDGTGGGGGGGKWNTVNKIKGGNGGSGIVILQYRKNAVIEANTFSKRITLRNESSFTQIYKHNGTLILNSSITAEILVVGGGGGGGGGLGGGGGAGAVVHLESVTMPIGQYTINVGEGGLGYQLDTPSSKGSNSSITNGSFNIIAEGGGGTSGGHDKGIGLVGGSGGGAASPNQNNKNKGGAAGSSSSLGGFTGTINGYRGGDNTDFRKGGVTNATGGGGAGAAAVDTDPSSGDPGNGGIGKEFNITGENVFYGGGGGGGGHHVAGYGGVGGGGNGSASGNGGEGADNTGGGGGGGAWHMTYGGKGGSGIVVIKYNNTNIKTYKMSVGRKTYFTIKAGGITKTLFLHGVYRIAITASTSTLSKDPTNLSGITTLNIEGATNGNLTFSSNQIDIIYNIFKSTYDINSSDITTAATVATNIYTGANTIPYINTKYNKYKISTNISKTYKTTTNGVDGINFNIKLYSNTSDLINSNNYSIRYNYPQTVSPTDVIIPLDIYITINPIAAASAYTSFTVKTYSRTLLGGDDAEIYAFIGNVNIPASVSSAGSTTINDFNNIANFTTSLSEKEFWGIIAKEQEITTLTSALVSIANINTKCSNEQPVQICNLKKLLEIKNAIDTATFTSDPPLMIENVPITSTGLFPMSVANPVLNYNITDYISYESSTQKAPANRITTFNIKDSASKYVYFAIPQAAT